MNASLFSHQYLGSGAGRVSLDAAAGLVFTSEPYEIRSESLPWSGESYTNSFRLTWRECEQVFLTQYRVF